MDFVANFMHFPAVQKIWKSVKIWQSYRQLKGGNFFETQCSFCSDGLLFHTCSPVLEDDSQQNSQVALGLLAPCVLELNRCGYMAQVV